MMYSLPNVYKWILTLLTVESSSAAFPIYFMRSYTLIQDGSKNRESAVTFSESSQISTVSSKALRIMDKNLGGAKDSLDLIALISCIANSAPLGKSKVVNPHSRGFI